MKREKTALTRDFLKSILDYDPKTGAFTWKWRDGIDISVNTRDAGKPAGTTKDGYLVIMIDGRQYRAHRLAYFMMIGRWPKHDIDHHDLDRMNNAWDNIRPATRSQNHGNKGTRVDNTSGYKGVDWHSQNKCWRARIGFRGKVIHLGTFASKEAAAEAYRAAALKYFGRFARY
jgi:hypothetical protein